MISIVTVPVINYLQKKPEKSKKTAKTTKNTEKKAEKKPKVEVVKQPKPTELIKVKFRM